MSTVPEALQLPPLTAADLMARDPIVLRAGATPTEAAQTLTERGISAAPVVDETGRPIGVVSRSDLLLHQTEVAGAALPAAGPDRGTTVRDVMTPAVFAVAPAAPASQVVSEMLGLNVHRLFVVDDNGVLVGVITTMDVLRRLQP